MKSVCSSTQNACSVVCFNHNVVCGGAAVAGGRRRNGGRRAQQRGRRRIGEAEGANAAQLALLFWGDASPVWSRFGAEPAVN